MKSHFPISIICVIILSSCIEEYHLSNNVVLTSPDIVIQGHIISGNKSVFFLSQTQPLGSDQKIESVLNAEITIIGQNGFQSDAAKYDIENDFYIINTEDLPSNTLYAIKVNVENEVYQSEFQALMKTPEITDITYKEREDGISIHVTTYGDENSSPYYLWAYEEDWEYHAQVDIAGVKGFPIYSSKYYPDGFKNGINPYYYCWKHNNSKIINLYNTEVLDENSAKEIEFLRIPIDDCRISFIYSILLKQYSLSKEAFQYYSLMKLYTQESSGLFTPMPTEVKGNVTCTSNPSKRVQGYVLASDCKTKRMFIYESDFKQIRSKYDGGCYSEKARAGEMLRWEMRIWNEGAVGVNSYMPELQPLLNPQYMDTWFFSRECIDCRAVDGATKKRPDFWPNDHE